MANIKKKANLGNITSQSMRRLTSGILKDYGLQMLIVLICVIVAALADAYGMLFIRKLIDYYITPLLHAEQRNFAPLLAALQHIALIYLISVVATYIYSHGLCGTGDAPQNSETPVCAHGVAAHILF